MRVLWLADVLRAAGLTVVEHSGWQKRGWEPWEPRFGIVHATAAPRTQSDETQVKIVRDGHSKLQGPIANCCVDRTGRWHVLASGRCNTALVGWAGPASGLGNTYVLGVEACNDNRGEPWPKVQYEAYARGWAAICRRMGWPAKRVVGHKEHQPGDKSDPSFSMTTFRRDVAAAIEGDDMPSLDEIGRAPWARKNPTTGETYSTLLRSRASERDAERLLAGQKAILAAVAGGQADDVLAAVERHAQEAAEDRAAHAERLETLLEAATAQVDAVAELIRQHQTGALDAEAVVEEIGRRLSPVGQG